jgi:ubiquinone/menaquinone biosynthesis C-methylase UbiE
MELHSDPTAAPDAVRDVAIDHHHDLAGVFEQHYRDMSADRFRTAFTYGRGKVDQLLDEQLKMLPPGAKVLDVGCGTGVYLARFRELGFEAHGVEPAPGMIEAARRLDPSLSIVQGVATKLPFEDGSFDLITAIEVLRYLHREDIQLALAEMMRVLRPGGRLFVTMVNRWALDGFYLHQRLRQRIKGRAFDRTNPHCEFTTPAELQADLRMAGADDVQTFGRLFAPMRIAYKIAEPVARKVARLIEPYDDALCSLPITTPFAGHLVGVGVRRAAPR